jgi:hypothetical protein
MIVAYVSSHGYGHATRVGEVLRLVREKAVGLPIAVVTAGPEGLYRGTIPGPLLFRSLECDVGVAQSDALTIDKGATLALWRSFQGTWEARVETEAAWLGAQKARLVLGDIPPLAFAASARAGVASVALANFSWDWIYQHWSRKQPAFEEPARAAAEAYGTAGLLLKLPFAGDLTAFPHREAIPLVARRPRLPKEEARRRLGADGRPLVLISFGGLGLRLPLERLTGLREFQFALSEERPPEGILAAGAERLAACGMGYADLVGAADVVVTKPGYGIVSDAIGAGTRLVYTERGDFPEYPILVREMSAFMACSHVSNDDLLSGRLTVPIRTVLEKAIPEAPDLSGARRAADRILEGAG